MTTANSAAACKMVHSPYATPVLNAADMCQANRDYYGCSSSSSDDEREDPQHQQEKEHDDSPSTERQPSPQQQRLNAVTNYLRGAAAAADDAPKPPAAPSYLTTHQRSGTPISEPGTEPSSPTRPHSSAPIAEFHPTMEESHNCAPIGSAAPAAVIDSTLADTQQPLSNASFPEAIFHLSLKEVCEFIQPPQFPVTEYPTPSFPCYRLFLGQIRFETTAAEVRWIIEFVCGVRALKVESRGIGCFLAYFRTIEEMGRVQQLHKRILFDHSGIWFARSDSQAEYLAAYVKEKLTHIGRGFRLPKDMMVVEEEKLVRPLPIPAAPPSYPGYCATPPRAGSAAAPPPQYGQQRTRGHSNPQHSPSAPYPHRHHYPQYPQQDQYVY